MMTEEFKAVPGYEGLYEVSNLGNVRRMSKGVWRPVKPWRSDKGYLEISLSKNGIRKARLLHRIVAELFLGGEVAGLQVNHINEDKTDNRVCNLEWCSAKHNANHGTRKARISENANHKKIFIYVQLSDDGSEIARYYNHAQLKAAGFNVKTISTAVRKGWKHGGYKWLKLKK